MFSFSDSVYRGASTGLYDGNEAASVINKAISSTSTFGNKVLNMNPKAAKYGAAGAGVIGGVGMFNQGRQDGGFKGSMEMGAGAAMIGAGAYAPFGGTRYARQGLTNVLRSIHGLRV